MTKQPFTQLQGRVQGADGVWRRTGPPPKPRQTLAEKAAPMMETLLEAPVRRADALGDALTAMMAAGTPLRDRRSGREMAADDLARQRAELAAAAKRREAEATAEARASFDWDAFAANPGNTADEYDDDDYDDEPLSADDEAARLRSLEW
jgi:hypothetical protein